MTYKAAVRVPRHGYGVTVALKQLPVQQVRDTNLGEPAP